MSCAATIRYALYLGDFHDRWDPMVGGDWGAGRGTGLHFCPTHENLMTDLLAQVEALAHELIRTAGIFCQSVASVPMGETSLECNRLTRVADLRLARQQDACHYENRR
jgi:hypothetical protein